MRITVDSAFQLGDKYTCNQAGQEIDWNGQKRICTEDDLMTTKKTNVLKQTMSNVATFVKSFLSVEKLEKSFPIELKGELYELPTFHASTASDCDYYLSVFTRPFGEDSTTLAQAIYVTKEEATKRPIFGVIFINARMIPDEAQKEDSSNNNFFYVCLHELFHGLGLSSDLFNEYHPFGDNTPYSKSQKIFEELDDPETGKHHQFLVTPNAHKFAVKQWGVEEFVIGNNKCTSGIEIEDGGGSGTAGSHPECRIGSTDIMIGVSLQQNQPGDYTRITPLTAALLLDSGFFQINWQQVKPLIWGNKDSTSSGEYITNFAVGPPATTFPQQYFYVPGADIENDTCGFDFKHVGALSTQIKIKGSNFDCTGSSYSNSEDSKAYCQAEKFYNPNNAATIGQNWPFDFQHVHIPTKICGKDEACIGGLDRCASYGISQNEDKITLAVFGGLVTISCTASDEGKIITGEYFTYRCPPLKQFIHSVRMVENFKSYSSNPLEDGYVESNDWNTGFGIDITGDPSLPNYPSDPNNPNGPDDPNDPFKDLFGIPMNTLIGAVAGATAGFCIIMSLCCWFCNCSCCVPRKRIDENSDTEIPGV